MPGSFDICIVAQAGRLSYEAVLFAASLRHAAPGFAGDLIVGEPQNGPLWVSDPSIEPDAREALERLGAKILPFTNRHFGTRYPHGNKVELLAAMQAERPFLFFDTDTLITGPIDQLKLDFDRPSASMSRENTWPIVPLYGPDLYAIWRAVFERAEADLDASIDPSFPEGDWERHLYFNAGWFFFSCPQRFAEAMIALMTSLERRTPEELACQKLYPWLDQIALPPVITKLGGGRPGPECAPLDGAWSIHWRALPLLYAAAPENTVAILEEIAAPNRIKRVLKSYEPFKRMIYQRRGAKVRALFDQNALPRSEKPIRNRIKREKLWMR